MRLQFRTISVVALAVAGLGLLSLDADAESKRERRTSSGAITKLKFDASAETVELFKGMKEGVLETKVIALGPFGGNLLISNKTDKPLTIDMPQSFVTVHVLKQFGQQGGGGGGFGGGGGQQGGGQGGGQQQQGGGQGQQGGGQQGGGQQGGGQNFFSIPPEKTVKVPYVSVCLNHGKPDPTPRSNRIIVPVDEYTKDPVLQELISMVGTGRLPAQSAQAAVWNRTDNMSWQQLAHKYSYGVLGNKLPYFSSSQIQSAQTIVAMAVGRVRERGDEPQTPETVPVRSRVR